MNHDMIQHYLKVAVRNILKYKLQSITSIVGLAVGFTCFTFATLWIRHELTYDSFHQGAERIYLVRAQSDISINGLSNRTPYPLAAYLQKSLPEVEAASNVQPDRHTFLRLENESKTLLVIGADSAFMQMFGIELLKGSNHFLQESSSEVAITAEWAAEIFGQEDPIGKELDLNNRKMKIGAVVTGWSKHSNLPYGVLRSNNPFREWRGATVETFIRLNRGVDTDVFEKKIAAIKLTGFDKESGLGNLSVTPITALRYAGYLPQGEVTMSMNYIVYFCLISGLVIVCSLFNYLTLFISRLRMRGRELALRRICGAGTSALFVQLAVEFLIVLVSALLMGVWLIELFGAKFLYFSELSMTLRDIHIQGFCYLSGMMVLSFTGALIPIHYFRKRTLHESINGITADRRQETGCASPDLSYN